MPSAHQIPIQAVIEELRRELEASVTASEGKGLRFGVEQIEIELQVAVGEKQGDEVGAKLWVFHAGMKDEVDRRSVQTVRLTLAPRDADGGKRDLRVAGRRKAAPAGDDSSENGS